MMPAPLLALALLAAAPEATNPFISQAKALYQKLEFEKCLMRLDQASRLDSSKQQLAELELYAGLCLLGLGNEREAIERLEMALKLDRRIELPTLVSPKVTALFDRVRAGLGPNPDEPALPPPVPDAPTEAKLVPSPPPALVVAPEPKPLRLGAPLALGGAAVAVGIVGGVLGALAKTSEAASRAAFYESDALSIGARAQTEAIAANVCFGVAGAVALAAIVTFLVQN